MVDIEFIRKRHFVDGWSIRKLSRQLGIARQTVRKALASAEPPRYRLKRPRPCPVMDPYREVILAWLKQDDTAPRVKSESRCKSPSDRVLLIYAAASRSFTAWLSGSAPRVARHSQ